MYQEAETVRPYELRARSAKTLLQRLHRNVTALVADEIDLAKAEVRQSGAFVIGAARIFALASAVALLAFACISAAAIVALASAVSFSLAALIVGAIYAVLALALGSWARLAFRRAAVPIRGTLGALLTPPELPVAQLQARVELARCDLAQTVTALERKTDVVGPVRDVALGLGALGVAMNNIARE